MSYKETREITLLIPKHYWLELEDIAKRHMIDAPTMAAQVVLTFIINYRKANDPLINDVHKVVEDNCQPTNTPASVVGGEVK